MTDAVGVEGNRSWRRVKNFGGPLGRRAKRLNVRSGLATGRRVTQLGYGMIKCHYCGRENRDETAPCTDCGTPPAPSPDELQGEPRRPVSAMGLLDCAFGVAEIATGHVLGVVHVLSGVSKLDSTTEENSPHRLLEQAAVMESVDMRQAVALYMQIVLNHPGTPAAEEADRNVQTLKAAHPALKDVIVAPPKDLPL